jgi:cyclopropane fatty-acyl-phospholipid synthase-like methyltransferase
VNDPRTELVGRGYDVIGERFAEWRDRIVGDPRREWAAALTSRLQPGVRVLELGCGDGVPDTQLLAEQFLVTGMDVSAEQIRRARANVPDATFVQADFTTADLDTRSFEAVAAIYSLNHVPRDLLADLFGRIHAWLAPGGLFLTALGTSDTEGWTGDFLGAPTYFSSYPPARNRELLHEAGFELVLDEVCTFMEPEGEATFQWVLARR